VSFVVFKLRLKYSLNYRINTVKLKSNANIQKEKKVNNRLVILLLLLGFCFGCGKDESFLKIKIFFCVDDVDEKNSSI
jgi:hypothetical protein|tara:strand:- start:414 stop:647 length:234 start_codon:yes stop_codon:yes gene_type:complete